MARPSCRKKNSMNSIMKKPTSVPNRPRATLPPMAAADFSSVCTLSLTQPCTSPTLTEAFSRTHSTALPMSGTCARRSAASL